MEENIKQELNEVEQTNEVAVNSETTENTSKKTPPNVAEVKSRRWLPYIITTAVLAVLTVLIGWARGGFTETKTDELLRFWCDAFSVSGILGLGFGLLVLASNGGAFDMLSYGVKSFFRLFKKDPVDRKYGGYYEYQQARKAKKRSFWYLVIVGGAFLAVAIVLLIIYFQILSTTAPTE